MYQHKLMHVNYTSYNIQHVQDAINFSNSHHNIILLAGPDPNTRPMNEVEFFKYAWVLGTFHINVIYIGPGSMGHQSQRIEFLWVWWYKVIGAGNAGWMHSKLDRLHFPPIAQSNAFGFVNPSDVIRGYYINPRFSLGWWCSNGEGISYSGKDSEDWVEYCINRWAQANFVMKPNEVTQSRSVDHDMLMRFYLGHAVRHTYTHSVPPIETTAVIPACEDVDIVLAPSDCGDGEGSSSGSEDSESTSINSDGRGWEWGWQRCWHERQVNWAINLLSDFNDLSIE